MSAKARVADTARHAWSTAELSMQEKSHSSPPTSSLLISQLLCQQHGQTTSPCTPGEHLRLTLTHWTLGMEPGLQEGG